MHLRPIVRAALILLAILSSAPAFAGQSSDTVGGGHASNRTRPEDIARERRPAATSFGDYTRLPPDWKAERPVPFQPNEPGAPPEPAHTQVTP